ncbi:MAG: hypothetical protein ACI4KL_00155 [Lentihominibacter sp.]
MKLPCSDKNSRLVQHLEKAVKENRITHAYIFEGPKNMDKLAFAKGLVKGVLCPDGRGENCGKCEICSKVDHDNHEDVFTIEKDGLSIKDSDVSLIQEKLNVKPFGEVNVVILKDCDTMTAKAQNRLLKTLEEPPGQSLLILLSENMENLTQTILSRCVKFRIEADELPEGNETADKIVRMCMNRESFYSICKELKIYLKDREKAETLLDSMELSCRNLLNDRNKSIHMYTFDDIYNFIHTIEDARQQVKKGMSTSYSLKRLVLMGTNKQINGGTI